MKGTGMRVPSQIGPYQLKQCIGSGAFSVVHVAIHTKTNEMYACKCVTVRSLQNEVTLLHFENEIRVLHQMRHPNVVQFLDLRRDSEYYYVFVEFCQGGELFQYVIEKRFLGEDEAKFLMRQFLEALKYVHRLRVVHRDLKPENLLLDKTGMVKISDFGFSRFIPEDNLVSTSCGSPAYASPECISGNPYDGIKSDMWSVGVIMFACVTGSLPWTEKNDAKILQQIANAEFKMPNYVSQPLKTLIMSLINVDVAQRPTCEEVLASEWFQDADTFTVDNFVPCGVSLKYLDHFFHRDVQEANPSTIAGTGSMEEVTPDALKEALECAGGDPKITGLTKIQQLPALRGTTRSSSLGSTIASHGVAPRGRRQTGESVSMMGAAHNRGKASVVKPIAPRFARK